MDAGSNSSVSSPALVLICLFECRRPCACEVVSHCVMTGVSLIAGDEHAPHMLLAVKIPSLEKSLYLGI